MKAKCLTKIDGIFYKPGDDLPKKNGTKPNKDEKDVDAGDETGK